MGLMQGIGGFLFGDAGKNEFEPDPYQVRSGAHVDTSAFNYDQSAKYLALDEFDKNNARIAPQAQGPAGPVQVSGFSPERYGGSSIDTRGFERGMSGFGGAQTDARRSRAQQSRDLGLMRSAAQGEAPSVAEQQLKQGAEQSIKAQQAAAASARGGAGARAAANRQAAFQGAETMTQTNQQAAALRAGEMAQAREQLMAGGQALRAGDIDQQSTQLAAAQTALQPTLAQAQLQQQAGLQTQQLGAQAGMQQTGLQTQAGLQNQQLQNQIALANLQSQLQSQGMQNQYNLGLMGQVDSSTKAALGADITREQLLANVGMSNEQMRFEQWKAEQNLKAGVAAGNAQTDLMTGTAGLGFLGGLASSYIGTS